MRMREEYYEQWESLGREERRRFSDAKRLKTEAARKAWQRASQRLADHENAFGDLTLRVIN